jgi:hypothetical protein
MSVAYINYHRKPRVQFTSISDYNEIHGTNIEQNEEFENAFETAWMAARYETDPNDYIQHTFGMTHGLADIVGKILKTASEEVTGQAKGRRASLMKQKKYAGILARKSSRKLKQAASKIDDISGGKFTAAKGKAKDLALSATGTVAGAALAVGTMAKEKAKRSLINTITFQDTKNKITKNLSSKKKGKNTEVDTLEEKMDFLDDYATEEQSEDKSEESPAQEVAQEVAEEQVEQVEEEEVSLSDQIDSFLADNAKDSQQFARDRSHVVHFNTASDNLKSRLMKGRDRYMKRLQQYADGDTSVKIRMMDNQEYLLQSLKPNIASLKNLLTTPHGEPRFCVCDC